MDLNDGVLIYMAKNKNLHKARSIKNDEFYTKLSTVEKELVHYTMHFKDKTVLCNCDDPCFSAFWKYFHLNFSALGLKKLISTHYNPSGCSYEMVYCGGDDSDIGSGEKIDLVGDGDFRNDECVNILKTADIVVTNPPFSLFREYVSQLIEYNKKFLIIGSKNCISYKEVFPFIRNNELWLGHTSMNTDMMFTIPKDREEELFRKNKSGSAWRIIDGVVYARSASIWYTNIDHKKRHEWFVSERNYLSGAYSVYDKYPSVINVDRMSDIPVDYKGVMGVPITFLDKYNPDQFEIVAFRKDVNNRDLVFTRDMEVYFNNTFVSAYDGALGSDIVSVRRLRWESHRNDDESYIEPIDMFYPMSMVVGGCMNSPKDTAVNGVRKYARILIRWKL